MKRWLVIGFALLGLVFAAPTASADGPRPRACFGGNLVLAAEETAENVALFGCHLEMKNGARVLRDLVSFGGNVTLAEGARIGGDVAVFGGHLRSAGRIDGDVAVFGGNVTLESTAMLDGDLAIFGGVLNQKEGAVVRGRVERSTETSWNSPLAMFIPFRNGMDWFGAFVGWIVRGLVYTLALGALGALILVFLPTQLNQVASVAEKSALPSIGVGCLAWLVVPPLIILFAITCLGIPLSLVLGIVFVAAMVLGWVAISLIVGDRLLDALKVKNLVPLLAMFVGLIALWLVTSLPVLGTLIWLFLTALALGAVALTRFGTRAYPQPLPTSTIPTVMPTAPPPASDDGVNI
ncbi:MAG: polymer-forming cytoskeletal protein [Anaerolineae bacterium]|nr:polymer-forming cytoskeletal protein [Anaerolineae bacterium]